MIDVAGIRRGDQIRALWLSTIAFTVCFAVWTIFSIIGVQIKKDLGLNDTQFGLLVGTPILTGSLIRLMLGIWADQYGGRIVYVAVMLSAAVATWLLTFAYDYPTFLLAALGVGIAGGSFAVGITYVSKWFPKESQGTALGIFGAGNVGAAVTKFIAPFIMVAYGWKMVANVWAIAIALTAVAFWLMTKDDPQLEARRRSGAKPEPLAAMLEPLKNIQVWRFSLYYFFVFGGFVALALWLPRYLIGVYGLDITTAGMIGAAYSVPASLFRVYGGVLSDKYGARRIMYWTFGMSVVCCFVLSYPPTEYVVQGIRGPMSFRLETGLVAFTVIAFVLGFFMSLGKAAVYKHIPVYYPQHVGSVGGVVGLVGGLGGFVLPILFGALNDLTGVWQSCFMALFALSGLALVWMHLSIRAMEKGVYGEQLKKLPELPEMQEIHEPKHVGVLGPHLIEDWRPEDQGFWQSSGRKLARRNLLISIPSLLLSFAVWMVWSVVVAKLPAIGFAYTTDQLFWLAALPGLSGATLRIFYSFMVPIFGGRLWTTLTTWSLLIPALGIGMAVQNPATPYWLFLALALLCGFGGGNFASSMANISFFFPKAEKGNALALNAGLGNLGVSVVQFVVPLVITAGVFGWFGGEPIMVKEAGRSRADVAAECRLHLGAVHRRQRLRRLVRHERHRICQGLVRRAGGDLREEAQLDHVLALHRHLRLVHRLFGGLPAARQDAIPRGERTHLRIPRPAGRRAVALAHGMGVGQVRRRPRHLLGIRRHGYRRRGRPLLPGCRQLARLLRHVPVPVLRQRRRQRLHLPDDPGDHAHGDGPTDADGGPRHTREARGQGKRGDHRLHLRDRGLRRILHPQELRHLDSRDWRAAGSALGFLHLLPELHRHHLVVLHAARRSAARHRAGWGDAVRPHAHRSTS